MTNRTGYPMNAGRIFERGGGIFRLAQLKLFFLAAAFLVPVYVLMAFVAAAYSPALNDWSTRAANAFGDGTQIPPLPANAGVGIPSMLLAAIILMVGGVAATGALIHAIDATQRGQPAPARASLARALARLPALVVAQLLYFVIAGVLVVVGLGVGSTFLIGGGIIAFIGLVIMVGAIAAVIFFAVRTSLMQQAIVLEGAGPIEGLARSWRLAAGAGWRVLGYAIVVGIIGGLIGIMVSGFPGALLDLSPLVGRDVAIGTGLDASVDILVAPITPLVFTLLYYDLRFRRGEPPVPGVTVPEPAAASEGSVPEEQP